MKVIVTIGHNIDDASTILGVFSTMEQASACMEKYKYDFQAIDFEEWEVE